MPETRTPARAVAEWLRAYRADNELTQVQLAARIGRQQSYVARLEGGTVDVQLSTLLNMAQALGVEINITMSADGDCDGWSCR